MSRPGQGLPERIRARMVLLASETPGRIVILAGAILVLWLGGAIVGTLIGAYPTFNEAVWDSIWHMIDPGALGDDENTKQRALGAFLAIAGLIILAGAALTLFEELVDRALGRLGSADPPISTAGHLLVVGDNAALPAIVSQVAAAKQRGPSGIVVLVPAEDPSHRQNLRRELAPLAGGTEVSVVGGDIHDDALDRVCAADAAGIVVLAPETGNPDATDLRVLGIGAALATSIPDQARPPVSLQMNRGRNVDVVWDQFSAGFDALVEDRATAATIALCLTNPAFAEIFTGLDERGSVFLLDNEAGVPFGSLLDRHPGLLPIGLARGKGAQLEPQFAPDPAQLLAAGEQVIALGDPAATTQVRRLSAKDGNGSGANGREIQYGGTDSPPALFEIAEQSHQHLLIIGWSDAAQSLVTELIDPSGVNRLTVFDESRPAGLPDRIGSLQIKFIDGRPDDPAELTAVVATAEPSHVLVAATSDSDAQAAFAVLRLERFFRTAASHDPAIRVPAIIAQQSSTVRARQLRLGLQRAHVVCSAELIGQTVSYSAIEPEALAVWEKMADGTAGNIGRVTVRENGDGTGPFSFAAIYPYMLSQGIAPLTVARNGRQIEDSLQADTRILPGDEFLVVQRL